MPSDQFYGGSGVEILYPLHIMNGPFHPFSDPEWSSSNLVSRYPVHPHRYLHGRGLKNNLGTIKSRRL